VEQLDLFEVAVSGYTCTDQCNQDTFVMVSNSGKHYPFTTSPSRDDKKGDILTGYAFLSQESIDSLTDITPIELGERDD